MKPHLVESFTGRGGTTTTSPEVWQRILSLDAAQAIAAAMEQAVNGRLGRQFTTGAQVTGLTVAGKSGTAELGGSGEPNSWFIGFAPAGDAQVAIAVVVEQGGRGAERAAPIAGQMLAAWKKWAGK
jgi:peptidoglycan glycosyltransferase